MTDLFNYKRRAATVAHVGRLNIGGDNPVRVQSMTTTSTSTPRGAWRNASASSTQEANWCA